MTKPTPHGQVPEALIDLIDAYAETRHRYGRIHNARTEAARNAVIEALSEVQALSAAPAIAKLRHLYQNMVNGAVRDTASAKRIAEGLLAPAIEALERATPPAEQQAQLGAVYAELGCDEVSRVVDVVVERCISLTQDATGIKVVYDPIILGDALLTELRDFADRTHALRMQAAPKAAPGVGNSGFDHKTAADFLNGKTVSDEAVRNFVATSRWAHDERAALSATLLAMHGVLTSREAEIALLKKALLEAEAAHQQEAQEPVVAAVFDEQLGRPMLVEGAPMLSHGQPLYTAPQPAPAPLSEQDPLQGAANWLAQAHGQFCVSVLQGCLMIGHNRAKRLHDAALAAQGGQGCVIQQGF